MQDRTSNYLSKLSGGGGGNVGGGPGNRMGFGAVAGTRISGLYSAGGADSGPEDREEVRKKEVDDLISKYASKKQNKLGGGQGSEWALPSSSSSASLAMPSYTAPQVWNFFCPVCFL